MCGIAGVFRLDGAPVSGPVVDRMAETLKHRGPDGEGVWVDRGVGLGHRRLAIIDTSVRSRQPMQTADGRYTLVFNGAIYNFRELRVELEARGHRFRSEGDTEVLLEAFAEWGLDAVGRFNGMFAFAIFDKHSQRLHLCRDRYGIKPLYYALIGQRVLFGSEVKAIMAHPAARVRVNADAVREYFTFQNIFTDLTLFDGVKMLSAGHTLTLTRGGKMPSARQYWDFDFSAPSEPMAPEECAEELSRLFDAAVNRQLVADVEVGAYLSGGVDSGAVTAVAAKHFKNLRTFTCGFDLGLGA